MIIIMFYVLMIANYKKKKIPSEMNTYIYVKSDR